MPLRHSCLSFLLLVLAAGVSAHPGGLDKDGGHRERNSGQYHCHREPCFRLRKARQDRPAVPEERAPFVTLYAREDWPHWLDVDGDCQNTRDEVLIRDSLVPVTFADAGHCDVEAGLWLDPYSGRRYTKAAELSIDHRVALQWAHGHGGEHWSRRRKAEFANDLDNLVAVASALNSAKGAKGPDSWLPAGEQRCDYLSGFVAMVRKYGLNFVEVEHERIAPLARACHVAMR